jgi:hypothetical protein
MLGFLVLSADTATWITAVSTLGVAAFGLGAVLFAWAQITEGRRVQKRQRVYDLQKQHDEAILPLMKDIYSFNRASDQASAKAVWKNWQLNEPARLDPFVRVFNFFEVVGSEYNLGLIDTKVAEQTLLYSLVNLWPSVSWFVRWLREESKNPRVYEQWQLAYKQAAPKYELPVDA